MYVPRAFREERIEVLCELIRQHPLATLVTLTAGGLMANHVPLIHDPRPEPWGTLRGHLSRANPQWQDLLPDVEALAIFQGPQTYISPSWYPTKAETGRVVPTWNYAVVHAYGQLDAYTDAERLRHHLNLLTGSQETGRPLPWKPDDAPAEFLEGMFKAIVGIEIRITRFEGKWKVSQNRQAEDRYGVIQSLEDAGTPETTAMADLVRRWSE